jgi:hypothetical protein
MKVMRKYNFAKAQNPRMGEVQKLNIEMATVRLDAEIKKIIKVNYVKLN